MENENQLKGATLQETKSEIIVKELAMLESIQSMIYEIRGVKVMLDKDLARMYGVETGRLNEAVKRNKKRFPSDFMFQLTGDEYEILVSQFAISNNKQNNRGGNRFNPYVFTEQGVAMLSSVLRSDIAVEVNINIMRAFIKMRNFSSENGQIFNRI